MALIAGSELDYLPDGPDGFGYAQGGFYSAADGFDYLEGYAAGAASVINETTVPTIAVVSPTAGVAPGDAGGFSSSWAVARVTPIVIRITDAGGSGNSYQCVTCRYTGASDDVVVYRRGSFRGDFAALSTETAISGGKELSILPYGGWPSTAAVSSITFDIDALDAVGNVSA